MNEKNIDFFVNFCKTAEPDFSLVQKDVGF